MNPDKSTGNNMDCVNNLPEIYRSCHCGYNDIHFYLEYVELTCLY